MKTMKMKILLKMVQLVECELDEMRYMSTDEKPVSDIRRKVVELRRMMVEYIDI